MFRRVSPLFLVVVLVLLTAIPALAAPGSPNFSPAVYADGKLYGSKFTTELPAPNAHNMQSFDKLFVITNGAEGQMPVAEAAPGNPMYDGGRWYVHTASWTDDAIDALGDDLPTLTSYADVSMYAEMGYLTIVPGAPAGGPPDYFQCPLLPVK